MCVNLCARASLCVCGWVICNCVCMCVNPQRYFNFFRILNKHAAAALVKRCLPVGFGLDGWRCWWWRGRGVFVAVALGGWGSSWSGPPPDTLAPRAGGLLNHHTPPPKPCQPWLPATPLPTQNHSILNSLSFILSYCLSHLPPSPLTRFPSSFTSFSWSKSRFICYLAAYSFPTVLLVAGVFSSGDFFCFVFA